ISRRVLCWRWSASRNRRHGRPRRVCATPNVHFWWRAAWRRAAREEELSGSSDQRTRVSRRPEAKRAVRILRLLLQLLPVVSRVGKDLRDGKSGQRRAQLHSTRLLPRKLGHAPGFCGVAEEKRKVFPPRYRSGREH